MERLPDKLNNQIFQKLKSLVEVERMTPNERLEYELSISVERDLSAALETSFEDGEAKGLAKGKAEGLAEGEAKGLAEGQRLIAARFKKEGVSLEIIAQYTHLSFEEIARL